MLIRVSRLLNLSRLGGAHSLGQTAIGEDQVQGPAEHRVVVVSKAAQTLETKLVRVADPDVRHDHDPSPSVVSPPIVPCSAVPTRNSKNILHQFAAEFIFTWRKSGALNDKKAVSTISTIASVSNT